MVLDIFECSSLPREMIQFDAYFSDGLKPPTRKSLEEVSYKLSETCLPVFLGETDVHMFLQLKIRSPKTELVFYCAGFCPHGLRIRWWYHAKLHGRGLSKILRLDGGSISCRAGSSETLLWIQWQLS